MWSPGVGTHRIDIVPFEAGDDNPYAKPGELHYERTYYAYRFVGPDENSYVCPSETWKGQGKRDFIKEYRKGLSADDPEEKKLIKHLAPKERQLFLVWDHADEEEGVQLWEYSYHNFGKLLDSRIDNADEEDRYDEFYFPEADGMTLKVTFEESTGGGYKYKEATAIDFKSRKEDLPEEILKQAVCLDELLVDTPYDEMKKAFLQIEDEGGDDDDDDDDPKSESESRSRTRKESGSPSKTSEDDVPEDDDDPDDWDEPEGEAEADDEPEDDEQTTVKCPACRGKGKSSKGKNCVPCGGTGKLAVSDDDDDEEPEPEKPTRSSRSKPKANSKSKSNGSAADSKKEKAKATSDDDDKDEDWDNWD